jgi:hypothetical protein
MKSRKFACVNFARGWLIVLAPFVEKTILVLYNCLCSFVSSQLTTCVDLLLVFSFVSLISIL